MRDVIGRMRWGMMGGGDMRDGPPPRNRPGRAAVFGPAPPNPQRTGNKNGKRYASRKRMIILCLTC